MPRSESIAGRHGKVIPTVQENVLPAWEVAGRFNGEIAAAGALALGGFVIVFVLERWARPR